MTGETGIGMVVQPPSPGSVLAFTCIPTTSIFTASYSAGASVRYTVNLDFSASFLQDDTEKISIANNEILKTNALFS